ncbi:hypothetical protein BVC80_9055g76 [Macleaya cordata]|uniref:Uncharacterized protein n=1 Tax=Macleaya cordata TaxID=56857 RepID=A0A200R9R8_MACCD|nr:hypothetical protein BVC80_9055g76 [Macleaya cordata]
MACTELKFNSIQLKSSKPGVQVGSICINAHGTTTGAIQPGISCLQNRTGSEILGAQGEFL